MKTIYNDFLGGISFYDKNVPVNTYIEGREIDPHRNVGYLAPGWGTTTVTNTDSTPQIINELITDICVDPTTDDIYFLGDTKFYHMSASAGETWNGNFDGSTHAYKSLSAVGTGEALFVYQVTASSYLFYVGRTNIGKYDLTSVFDDDWGSTIPAVTGTMVSAPHPTIEWESYRWIGNGQYLAKFDGATGSGSINYNKLNLGIEWKVTALFPTRNFIGVCAWRSTVSGSTVQRTESRIFFYDGSSDSWSYSIPVSENQIQAAYNHNGTILLWAKGRDLAESLFYLTENGANKIRKMKTLVAGDVFYSAQGSTEMYRNAVDNFGNRVIFGTDFLVWSYGNEEEGQPNAITIPWGFAGTVVSSGSLDKIGAIATVANNKVFISWKDNANSKYYISKVSGGYSPRATYRGNYTDFGQKIRLNYVKFYFKPLAANYAVTPTVDIDYGTSVVLKDRSGLTTIAYATDGAITSKRFEVHRDCHAFRPVVSWIDPGGTSNGLAISKIVFDYSFISDV
jgi:hypothetical protein